MINNVLSSFKTRETIHIHNLDQHEEKDGEGEGGAKVGDQTEHVTE